MADQVVEKISFSVPIFKVSEDEFQTVYGWASIVEKAGQPVSDRQDDIIRASTLTKAAHQYVMEERAAKVMHQGKRIGNIVESIVLTKDIQKSLGIEIKDKDGDPIAGWFIGLKISDPEVWKAVKAGDYTAFSIGGSGQRIEVDVDWPF